MIRFWNKRFATSRTFYFRFSFSENWSFKGTLQVVIDFRSSGNENVDAATLILKKLKVLYEIIFRSSVTEDMLSRVAGDPNYASQWAINQGRTDLSEEVFTNFT